LLVFVAHMASHVRVEYNRTHGYIYAMCPLCNVGVRQRCEFNDMSVCRSIAQILCARIVNHLLFGYVFVFVLFL
jgi:hypothetical protein